MEETGEDQDAPLTSVDSELNQLLGLFDAPAFVRRGQDLEYALGRLHLRCAREREERLEMVRVRLRQWASVACSPTGSCLIFSGSFEQLLESSGAQPPDWAGQDASPRRQRVVACDLIAAITRFNRRWLHLLDELDLDPLNRMIENYNRYYVLEKECSLGSAKLAARHFIPRPRLSRDELLIQYPLLPVPELTTHSR
ncbi:MAG: hypothetical protein P4L84_15200 [Isosphaeraceae bacterium]|nr:hypothetical protein [Isosphaeraceae bacterium]